MIPKIIHQTYASRRMPAVLAANVEHIRATNPGWEHRFYDDEAAAAFIARHCGQKVLAAWRSIDPAYGAARADLFRYLLMYKVGGVYLDMKSSTALPLDSVLRADDALVLAHWPNRKGERFAGWGHHPGVMLARGELQQWHVICAPGHPFLKAVVQEVLRNIASYDPARHGVGRLGVLRVTGPIAYTRAIVHCREPAPHRVIDTHEELGLVYSVVDHHGRGAHATLFERHYASQKHPIVLRA
ncbi:MAG TPA: glycosyltransferase [Ramlibacter sp.]|uniref:glycosyltransferase family 32 protein n=1 Tax=Ramlibacter sp. TaxID=1917967 RepID=UPI002C38B769|nr:glycosyltransferase [Ramlibacter sp.]HVZ44715.1 glycosyltransferase [Ramlibacter sp.]